MTLKFATLGFCAALLASVTTAALAHPHVWITARAEMVFSPEGKVSAIRHAWTFDKAYSAFVTQGLDTNRDGALSPEELQQLANENTESLVEFDYFTIVKANGAKQPFDAPRDARMTFEDGEVTLAYLLPLKSPVVAGKVLSLEIYDPTFFVAFAMADGKDAVVLAGGAPKGCATTISRPKPIDVGQQRNLSEAFFETLTAASDFGVQFANRALIACP
jgi:ABC-type uncharacterized transport system substrate-binding protein